MRPPEYLIRSMKANPDHAVVVYNFMKAASQFYKARWRLAHVAKKNNEIDLYFFKGTIGRPPKLQRRGGLSHSYQEPHTPEPDRILYISPALLHKQSEPLSEDLLSNGLDNRFERSTLGDLGQNWSNRSQPSTDTMNNIVDSNSLDTSSSSMCEIAAISLPKSSETTNCSTPDTNKIATQANMQASVENVSDEGDDIIPQSEQARSTADGESIQVDVDDVSGEGDNIISQKRARPTGDSENMQGRVEDVNVEGDDIVPQNKQARLTGKGDPLQRAGPRKKPSLKQGKKAKLAPSSVQKKSMDLAVQKTSPQQASSPPSMTRYHAYDQMRCLFGPDKENPEKEKTLSESDIAEILALYAKSSRPDLATFLENLSNLWRSNRFWSPDALHLSMPEELSLRSSCLRLFRYDWDLGKESGINVIRRRFVQLKLHLSFIRLCNEMTNPQSACFKTRLNSRRIASHAIDNLMKLDGSNGYSDDPLAPKDRGRFAKTNAKGRRWYLISHYIGWGSLIIFSNIDTTLAKVNLIGLEGFITYVLNTQPRVVALCHRYEQPVKDLLNGRKPALTLTEQEVKSTIGDLPHAIDHNEDAKNHWQRINTMIDTDVSEVLSHD